jgi:hypothetical protein
MRALTMSMPSMTLKCNRCGNSGGTSATFGSFTYIDGEEEFAVGRCLGWCDDCDSTVAMEEFEDSEALLTKLGELPRELRQITQKPWSLLLKRGARIRRDTLLSDLADVTFRLKLIRDRKGTEKCLQCGGEQVREFDGQYQWVGDYAASQADQATGFIHPGCGGEFIASGCAIRFHYSFDDRYFSVDGREITASAGCLNYSSNR